MTRLVNPVKVILVSTNKLLNTTLQKVIHNEMELETAICSVQQLDIMLGKKNGNSHDYTNLLLIDYIGTSETEICNTMFKIQENAIIGRQVSALYNVAHNAGIEKRMIHFGVRGIFYDDYDFDLFKKGIKCLIEGDVWFSRKVLFEYIKQSPFECDNSHPFIAGNNFAISDENTQDKRKLVPLTPREEEILIMVSVGKSNADIAEELYISASTVKTHIYNIFQKINVPNRIQAALWTVKNLKTKEGAQSV